MLRLVGFIFPSRLNLQNLIRLKAKGNAANHRVGLMIKMAFQTSETNYLGRVAL
jgi:hypothetical protein